MINVYVDDDDDDDGWQLRRRRRRRIVLVVIRINVIMIRWWYLVVDLTHAITVGTQENRISHHRQISRHKEQIAMGTAHSSHPMTSPNLNKTMRALWKTTRTSIRMEYTSRAGQAFTEKRL